MTRYFDTMGLVTSERVAAQLCDSVLSFRGVDVDVTVRTSPDISVRTFAGRGPRSTSLVTAGMSRLSTVALLLDSSARPGWDPTVQASVTYRAVDGSHRLRVITGSVSVAGSLSAFFSSLNPPALLETWLRFETQCCPADYLAGLLRSFYSMREVSPRGVGL